jgi:hypothetical protein
MLNIDQGMPLAETGSWASYAGSEFLIAHLTSIRFQRELATLQQPYRKKIESGSMDPKVSKELLCKAMARGLVLDWKKVVDSSQNEIPFSVEAAYKALMNNPEFREFISDFAANLENFREAELEEVGKS